MDGDINLTYKQVMDFIEEKVKNPHCDACGSNNWTVAWITHAESKDIASFYGFAIADADRKIDLERGWAANFDAMRPTIPIQCNNCGYTRIFGIQPILKYFQEKAEAQPIETSQSTEVSMKQEAQAGPPGESRERE